MGTTQAYEMAHANIDPAIAMGWHLQANHYPPLPGEYIPVCLKAVERATEAVVDEDTDIWDEMLELPNVVPGPIPRAAVNGFVSVGTVIGIFHLDSFVEAAVTDMILEEDES